MNLRRASAIGVSVSLLMIIVYTLLLGVKIEDVMAVGLPFFIAASLLASLRLVTQGVRFYVIARHLDTPRNLNPLSSVGVRIASEFVTLVTPSYVGGEPVRAAWLVKKGARAGQAIWVAYLEVLYDVVFGSVTSLVAALFALLAGGYLISALILVTTVPILVFYVLLTVLSIKGAIKLPRFVFKLLRKVAGPRITESLEATVEGVTSSYREAASKLLGSSSIRSLAIIATLSFIKVLLAGAIFMTVLGGFGVESNLLLSTLAVYSAISLGTIPFTPGGSGLSELGISLFTGSVYSQVTWPAIVAWRIASYYVPLAITAVALIVVTHREMASSEPKPEAKTPITHDL